MLTRDDADPGEGSPQRHQSDQDAGAGQGDQFGSSEIFCQIFPDMPVVMVSMVLMVSRTRASSDSSAQSAATLPIRESNSEQ